MGGNQQITSEARPDRYVTIMMNMADDELDPYEYRLLAHYVRRGGHSLTIPEGIRDTAAACKMSITKTRAARTSLEKLGYLKVTEPTPDDVKRGLPTVVNVIDRWSDNVAHCQKYPVPDLAQGYAKNSTGGVLNVARGGVPDLAHIELGTESVVLTPESNSSKDQNALSARAHEGENADFSQVNAGSPPEADAALPIPKIVTLWHETFHKPVPESYRTSMLAAEAAYSWDWIASAFAEAVHAEARLPWPYIRRVLQSWREAGEKTTLATPKRPTRSTPAKPSVLPAPAAPISEAEREKRRADWNASKAELEKLLESQHAEAHPG